MVRESSRAWTLVEICRHSASAAHVAESVHIFWRVTGFDHDLVEDCSVHASWGPIRPDSQNNRLPGGNNHKRADPHLATIEYRDFNVPYVPGNFPPVKAQSCGLSRSVLGAFGSLISQPSSERSDT